MRVLTQWISLIPFVFDLKGISHTMYGTTIVFLTMNFELKYRYVSRIKGYIITSFRFIAFTKVNNRY